MASPWDTPTLEIMINTLIGDRSDVLTEREIQLTAEALSLICSNYTADQLAPIVAKVALEKGERPVQWKRWDS